MHVHNQCVDLSRLPGLLDVRNLATACIDSF